MAIVSQNTEKHGFFVISDQIGGKSRRAGRLFLKNKANVKMGETALIQ